jgi:glycine/D-amino acid oxidase-like deaminating enzyme
METQIFLPYLQKQLSEKGVKFIEREIKSFDELTNDHDIVINCSALGSRKLCNDESIIPVRGQVGLLTPKNNMPIYLDNEKPLYVVPRKDAIIVGGTYEERVETEITEPATIERILSNAYEVFPELKQQRVIGSWAGLRPYRPEVRVEHEEGTNIIHNSASTFRHEVDPYGFFFFNTFSQNLYELSHADACFFLLRQLFIILITNLAPTNASSVISYVIGKPKSCSLV